MCKHIARSISNCKMYFKSIIYHTGLEVQLDKEQTWNTYMVITLVCNVTITISHTASSGEPSPRTTPGLYTRHNVSIEPQPALPLPRSDPGGKEFGGDLHVTMSQRFKAGAPLHDWNSCQSHVAPALSVTLGSLRTASSNTHGKL